MNDEERFQQVMEKEITRLTTPMSYPKLEGFTFRVAPILISSYVYARYIKDYTESQYKQTLKEEKTAPKENLSDVDNLFLLFGSKEKIAREMIEKKFPAPQLTNSKFNVVLDNCRNVVESQIEIINALTPTEKTKP